MPFIPVLNTLLVESVFEQDGQVIENTAYFEKPEGWDLGSVTAWLAEMRSLIESELLPLISSTVQFVRIVGTLLDAVDALSLHVSISPPVAGGATGFALPNNTAYVVTILTALRGRSARGRNYVPGLTTTDTVDNNHVTSTFRTSILSYYSSLLAAADTFGAPMVVVSRFSGVDAAGHAIPRVSGVTTPVTGFTTFDNVLDSQRRRLPGRGT